MLVEHQCQNPETLFGIIASDPEIQTHLAPLSEKIESDLKKELDANKGGTISHMEYVSYGKYGLTFYAHSINNDEIELNKTTITREWISGRLSH